MVSGWHGIQSCKSSITCRGAVVAAHLHDLLLLVHFTLGHGHVLLSFQVELRGIRIAPTNPLHRSCQIDRIKIRLLSICNLLEHAERGLSVEAPSIHIFAR